MTDYTGLWLHPLNLGRDMAVGDYVMIETLNEVIVEQVTEIKGGQLWYFNGCAQTIPHDQILAVKPK